MKGSCFLCLFLGMAIACSHDANFLINGARAPNNLFMTVWKTSF